MVNNKHIAFVPVRGGSKSVPLKNIKLLCGKPLIYWSLSALEKVDAIDEVIVATDSDDIERVVLSLNFKKVRIYRRLAINATDTASTESVILEYIERVRILDNNIFILVQATSPLTSPKHFTEALELYKGGEYDSLLTCTRCYRFFWNEEGNPINYAYKNRPRRQDFKGQLMENGAFYINTVGNIRKTKNRLCGKIGVYEMPEYTATEIDNYDDWIIIEKYMKLNNVLKIPKNKIKLFLTDVDGVLTDGMMYYSEHGDELKKFNTRDGMAFELLNKKGIKTGIITSETTKIVENRAKKLKVDFLVQGKKNIGKLSSVLEICKMINISLPEIVYVGDDINCKEILENVGYAFCPSDAVDTIKNIGNINIVNCKGGNGVIRYIVDFYMEN